MSTIKLTGGVSYITRELLPEVTLTVTMSELSAQWNGHKTIASITRQVCPGGPLTYTLEYDPGAVASGREYLLIAELRHGDRLYKSGTSKRLADVLTLTTLDIRVNDVITSEPKPGSSSGRFGWRDDTSAAAGIHGSNLMDLPGIHGGNWFDKP